jgi:peptidoglycan LD-endopeptidase LytH
VPLGGALVGSEQPRSGAEGPKEAETTAPRGPIRTFLTLVLAVGVLVVSATVSGVASAESTKDRLDAAKEDLAGAQAELDDAVAALNAAESRLAQTRGEIGATKAAIAGLEDRLDRISARLQRRAVAAFMSGPAETIDLLLSSGSFTDFTDRLEFLDSVTQSDADLVTEQEVGQEELRRRQEDLERLSEQQASAVADFASSRDRANSLVQGLADKVAEFEAEYRKELAAAQAAAGGGGSQVIGQTPVPGAAIAVCPVAGPNSFVDSFGWPRVGHTHQGIDLISPFGTPVVAAHSGTVSHSSSSSGGMQAYVRAGSGTYTFYAHLSSYSSASGSVSAGTVIGYVGSTGNAGSVNHLHFEYHPGGGAAVNPYQMLVAVC